MPDPERYQEAERLRELATMRASPSGYCILVIMEQPSSGTIGIMTTAPAYDNSVRIGYARVSTPAQDHQAQLDALATAHCREIIVETASTRGDRPKLREALGQLQAGDTLVIYKPDRVARSNEGTALAAAQPGAAAWGERPGPHGRRHPRQRG